MEDKKEVIKFLLRRDIQKSLDVEDFEYVYSEAFYLESFFPAKVTQFMIEELGISLDEILSKLKEVPRYSCYGMQSLTKVDIGNNISSIDNKAFCECRSLTSVTIPNSVTSIGKYAFYNCTSLTSITIGSGVTSIGDGAFEYCTSLTSITVPDSVTSIDGHAFFGCRSLTIVTIGNGVTSISDYAFYNCTSLTSITYSGTVMQFKKIKKAPEWRDTSQITVHCTDGDLIYK